MMYADYKKYDLLNGEGLRHSLFVSGCTHHCKGCFNAVAWNFNYGKEFTKEIEDMIINDLSENDKKIQGLSLLGGEPFDNVDKLIPLLHRIKKECSQSDIWCWTGYTFEYLLKHNYKMLSLIDVLVDGKFEVDKRDLKLKFRGSKNQRILSIQESLKQNKTILWRNGEY